MSVLLRCPLTQIPMDPCTNVVAIPLFLFENRWHIAKAPMVGELTENGTVVQDAEEVVTYQKALIVEKAASESLFVGRFAGTISNRMRQVFGHITETESEIRKTKDRAEAVRAYERVLDAFSFPTLLPYGKPADQIRKSEILENVGMLRECARNAGWLPYAEKFLGIRVEPSSEHRSMMDREAHIRIVGQMAAAVERDARLAQEHEETKSWF